MERHELFDLLDAWNPRWQTDYTSLLAAVNASDEEIALAYGDWLSTDAGQQYLATFKDVPDVLSAIRAAQEAEENSSLPFKMSNFGKAPGGIG